MLGWKILVMVKWWLSYLGVAISVGSTYLLDKSQKLCNPLDNNHYIRLDWKLLFEKWAHVNFIHPKGNRVPWVNSFGKYQHISWLINSWWAKFVFYLVCNRSQGLEIRLSKRISEFVFYLVCNWSRRLEIALAKRISDHRRCHKGWGVHWMNHAWAHSLSTALPNCWEEGVRTGRCSGMGERVKGWLEGKGGEGRGSWKCIIFSGQLLTHESRTRGSEPC